MATEEIAAQIVLAICSGQIRLEVMSELAGRLAATVDPVST